MNRQDVTHAWIVETQRAIELLEAWKRQLEMWEKCQKQIGRDEFDQAYDLLFRVGLDGWANDISPSIDELADMLRGIGDET
jgi:hypothetical protein